VPEELVPISVVPSFVSCSSQGKEMSEEAQLDISTEIIYAFDSDTGFDTQSNIIIFHETQGQL
jgi:hypothetical protein